MTSLAFLYLILRGSAGKQHQSIMKLRFIGELVRLYRNKKVRDIVAYRFANVFIQEQNV
jgi:hypothetical protein